MKKSKHGEYTRFEFYNHHEILDYVMQNEQPEPYSKAAMSDRYCPYTWDETIENLKTGWPEGVGRMSEIAEKFKTRIAEDKAYSINHDVTGDFLDIGRYMTGEPECFGCIIEEPRPTETLDITVEVGQPSANDSANIYNRGAAITALIDELQKQYFVNLKLIVKTEDSGFMNPETYENEKMELIFYIDTQNEYSRDLLAFYLSNSAFLRRIIWSIFETYFKQDHVGCYGNYGKQRYFPEGNELFFRALRRDLEKFENEEKSMAEISYILEQYEV